MSAALANSTSARGLALVRTFRAALAALGEHQKEHPGEVLDIAAMVMAHVRSAWPQALTTATVLEMAASSPAEMPVNEIERPICPGGKYRLSFDEGHLALLLSDDGDTACGVFTPQMAETLCADIKRVLGGRS